MENSSQIVTTNKPTPSLCVANCAYIINVKKTVSLKHSVRTLGHRSKKANIDLVRRRFEMDYLLLQVDVDVVI